ncbi:Dityrosine transporter 1 [Scheffersomyces spartinae]|uniref:Dityrosine transporter 1 n=1 Tax=Scheffersomyces spartinae TaxID=45513 RepID=A0A9P8AJ76_9ASCO|nr:Dityrosine transporter 1 [Scheffersomyces spartinae]KAG7194460.1 Dityrosine transporter 1 [Scheffersomyces spartinae]
MELTQEFKTTISVINGTVSVFMVVFAIAPIFWASISDFGGRRPLLLSAEVVFVVANIVLAAAPKHLAVLYIFRIIQAVGASTMTVGMGVVADICQPSIRARAISYYMLGPQFGPILGPILSIVGALGSWRWTFGMLAIFGFTVFLMITFLLPETLRILVGKGEYLKKLKTYFVNPVFKQKKIIPVDAVFPHPPKPSLANFVKLIRQERVWMTTVSGSFVFAAYYGVLVIFSQVLQELYGFTQLQVSLSYICPGVSLICGSILGGHLSDFARKKQLQRHPDYYCPEKRLSFQLIGTFILISGLLGYGWCAQKRVHVVSIFCFIFLCGFGMTWILNSNTTYLSECSTEQPATYVSIGNFGRNLGAAICSAIIHILVRKMGYGWCFTGLALVSLISAVLTVVLLIRGRKTRIFV